MVRYRLEWGMICQTGVENDLLYWSGHWYVFDWSGEWYVLDLTGEWQVVDSSGG